MAYILQLGSKVLIILVSAMLLTAMAGEALAYTPPIKVSIFPIFGTLNGYVKTSNGDAVPGANVIVYNSNNTKVGQATTDSHGFYNISLVGGTYVLTVSVIDVGMAGPVSASVTANTVTSTDLTIKTWLHDVWMIPSSDKITANGTDAVKIIIRLMDAYDKTPGEMTGVKVNVRMDNGPPIVIDPATFTDGGKTVTYGPLPPTTTLTSGNVSLYTTGLVGNQITNYETITIIKPAATPMPTASPSPSPTSTAPAVSQSATANTPTVSPEPANATAAGPMASNNPGSLQTQATGNGNLSIYIIGGILIIIAFIMGVGATYFLMQKKK